jgi:putative transposase
MVDDPAHYRWTSYRSNALAQPSAILTPHPLYQALGATDTERQSAYRALFRAQLDGEAISDIRLALNQSQPLGKESFYQYIEQMTGQRRESKPRGRPRVTTENANGMEGQGELEL